MNKRSSLKIAKKPAVRRRKKIIVTPRQARATVDIGNGFERHDFYFNVGPNTEYTFEFRSVRNRKPVSAGWFNSALNPMVTLSYPFGLTGWNIVARTGVNVSTQLGFFIVTKN